MDQQRIEIESLLYRTEKLEAKYAEIRHLVSGTGEDYTHLLKTKTGRYSSKAVNRMVNDLIECLAGYRSYNKAVRKSHRAKMEKITLSDEDRRFYEAYFYLMLGLATYDNTGFHTRYYKPGTWDALLDRVSEPVEYLSQAELDADLILFDIEALEKLRIPCGLFVDICTAYNDIMDDDFSSLLSDKERRAAYKLMTKEELHYAKNPDKKISDDERDLQDASADAGQQFWEEISESIAKALKEEQSEQEDDPPSVDDLADEYNASIKDWESFFTDKERFRGSCLTVKAGITERTGKWYTFKKEIETAVHLYLANNGISKIADDSFYTVYIYLERAREAAENNISDDQQ